jgi:hypothetical protein
MLLLALRSERPAQVNIAIIPAFVKLREILVPRRDFAPLA